MRANNKDSISRPVLSNFPSIFRSFSYANYWNPSQESGNLIWFWKLRDEVRFFVLAASKSSRENSSCSYMTDNRGARAVIRKLVAEEKIVIPAGSPLIKVMEDKFKEKVRPAQSGKGDLSCLRHYDGLFSINENLTDNRPKLQKPHENEQPISRLHFGIAGLILSVAAYWIAFCGAWFNWRRKWKGIALVALGFVIFGCGLVVIVLPAYYP